MHSYNMSMYSKVYIFLTEYQHTVFIYEFNLSDKSMTLQISTEFNMSISYIEAYLNVS